MVSFMSYKVTEKVHKIGREVLPGRWRKRPTARHTESHQCDYAVAALHQRLGQLGRLNRAAINTLRDFDAMARADHLDPHAPGVVYVRCDRPNRAARTARNIFRPQLRRQFLDQIHRHLMVCVPRGKQRLFVAGITRTLFSPGTGFGHGIDDSGRCGFSDAAATRYTDISSMRMEMIQNCPKGSSSLP